MAEPMFNSQSFSPTEWQNVMGPGFCRMARSDSITSPPGPLHRLCQICRNFSEDTLETCTVCGLKYGIECCWWKLSLCVRHRPENWTEEEFCDDSVHLGMMQEEDIPASQQDDEQEIGTQWVDQVLHAANPPMSFKRRVGHAIVALLATMLGIAALALPTSADLSTRQLH